MPLASKKLPKLEPALWCLCLAEKDCHIKDHNPVECKRRAWLLIEEKGGPRAVCTECGGAREPDE